MRQTSMVFIICNLINNIRDIDDRNVLYFSLLNITIEFMMAFDFISKSILDQVLSTN